MGLPTLWEVDRLRPFSARVLTVTVPEPLGLRRWSASIAICCSMQGGVVPRFFPPAKLWRLPVLADFPRTIRTHSRCWTIAQALYLRPNAAAGVTRPNFRVVRLPQCWSYLT